MFDIFGAPLPVARAELAPGVPVDGGAGPASTTTTDTTSATAATNPAAAAPTESSQTFIEIDEGSGADDGVWTVRDDVGFTLSVRDGTTLSSVAWLGLGNGGSESYSTISQLDNVSSQESMVSNGLSIDFSGSTADISFDFSSGEGLSADYMGHPMVLNVTWYSGETAGYSQSSAFSIITNDRYLDKAQSSLSDAPSSTQVITASPTASPLIVTTSGDSSSAGSAQATGTAESTTATNADATGTTSSGAAASSTSAKDAGDSSGGGGGLSAGAIAGIVVGSVVGLALIAGLIWFFLWRKRRRNNQGYGRDADASGAFMVEKDTPHHVADSADTPYADDRQQYQQPQYEQHDAPMQESRDIGSPHEGYPPYDIPSPGAGSGQYSHPESPIRQQQTGGVSRSVAHLVEEGMTPEEIRRLEEEERQLDDEIERAGRR